ncbi:MAG: molybdopterin-dependent oxidoreductase [Gemmatimonadota bacterium]|nr:molybdopterin-dependent oxidoreductase [Gemmatimonadota bacterium]
MKRDPGNGAFDRRRFMQLGGLSLSAFLAACGSNGPAWADGLLNFAERKNESVERLLLRKGARDMARRSAKNAGKSFPSYFISDAVPVWDESKRGKWMLEVSGAVKKPVTLSLEDLTKMKGVSQRVNHYCVEGWNAVAEWTGVRLSDLARLVEPTPDAQYVDFQSFDNDYHESWDLGTAMHPQTLVAYGMDGQMLGPMHGAPARLHSPEKLGYKNTKYLTKIVFMPARNGGYWSDQGYEWFGGT